MISSPCSGNKSFNKLQQATAPAAVGQQPTTVPYQDTYQDTYLLSVDLIKMSSKHSSKGPGGKKGHFRCSKSFKSKSISHDGNKSFKKALKFTPLDSRLSTPQATYVTVLEAIETEILKTFDKAAKDVATSIQQEEMWCCNDPSYSNQPMMMKL